MVFFFFFRKIRYWGIGECHSPGADTEGKKELRPIISSSENIRKIKSKELFAHAWIIERK